MQDEGNFIFLKQLINKKIIRIRMKGSKEENSNRKKNEINKKALSNLRIV